ncbi:MAG: alpha/beta hydrolase [Thermoplasmatales archaeon]
MIYNIDEYKINVEIMGYGEPVLLIHGLGSANFAMYPYAYYIKDFRRIYVDVPNHGKSGDYEIDLDGISSIFKKIMDNLSFEKFSIIGISMGSMIASIMANKYRDSVKKLVLISPTTHLDEDVFKTISMWSGSEEESMRASFSEKFIRDNIDRIREYEKLHPFDPMRSSQIGTALLSFDIRNYKIPTDTLILIGIHDILFGPRFEEYLREVFISGKIIKIDSGHSMTFEAIDKIGPIIRDFIKG